MTTTWTKIAKPSGTDHSVTTTSGTPIGLLMALTYAAASSVTTGIWTDISKATGSSWTDVAKAT